MAKRSPAMEQFFRAKQAYPDAVLFFRMGDFYEMFYEDAILAAELLDLTLTSRSQDAEGQGVPMAGVPHHAASGYIARLIEQGQCVAICEQMADPSKIKGIVPREVVRVITPGLVLEPDALDARTSNYLACVSAGASGQGACGLFVLELSTAEARACELTGTADALAELVRLSPREILLEPEARELAAQLPALLPKAAIRSVATDERTRDSVEQRHPKLSALIATARAQGFGELPLRAAAAGLAYAQASQLERELPIQRIAPYDPSDQLQLDEAAVRNLELVATLGGERKGSLLHLLDETKTSMGARLLRRRLLAPLTDLARIRRRHDRVQALLEDPKLRERVRQELSQVADLDRLASRAALGLATPRDLGALRSSLGACEALFRLLTQAADGVGGEVLAALAPDDTCAELHARLSAALLDELPLTPTAGGIFREQHDARVAELRALADDSKGVLLRLEEREREQTGISSLKVRYTKVFGYYMEISKARLSAVPAHFRRKQTVAGGERFTTEELEQLQAKILNADERLRGLEHELFVALRAELGGQSARLKRLGEAIADLDVHAALAELAHRHDYARPEVNDGRQLSLVESRHPIVERVVAAGGFVPNDVMLDPEGARLMLITGPNMAGKSTVMRQVALSVLMAQAGSFVPARSARIGIVDRIYTRVGASDNLAQGQSTFMVEMREAAAILRGATARSLVILDEIGRGTSTYDGLAIAWAVAEHLHDAIACRAMFATHYHELCELPRTHPYAVNFNVAARQHGDQVVFLHRLAPGGANRSYGIAVAQLAGVPEIVLARARTLLEELERSGASGSRTPLDTSPQLDMFATAEPRQDSEVEATLRALDPDRMPPVEALVALARLKGMLPPRE